MIEIVIAAAVVLVLLAFAVSGAFASARLLLGAGVGVLALGFLAGVAAGVVCHVRFFQELSGLGRLRKGWWWRPTSLHVHLSPAAGRRLMPWFSAGAAGFFVSLVGCALVFAAILTREGPGDARRIESPTTCPFSRESEPPSP